MSLDLSKIGVVVLAAGKGTRLNCTDKPKVMLEIGGRPIVSYVVETLKKVGFKKEQICLVVGFKKELAQDYFKDTVVYADQTEQKGTAHATYVGIKSLPNNIEQVLVLGGDDSAFYQPETLENLISQHIENNCVLTLLSANEEDTGGAGRIIKTEKGIEIIEKEYLTEDQKKINEISTGTFVFDRGWFERIFPDMPLLRKLGEYGLPTALAIAREANEKFQVIKLADANEWRGINTKEELEEANKRKLENK
ncbi:MAG: NTP transferase domain-containing protein [Candidatus Magasanikbacteria bacterium]